MNTKHLLPDNHDFPHPDLDPAGSERPDTLPMSSLSKVMVAIALMLGIVILAAVMLRVGVGLVSDEHRVSSDVNTQRVSRSKAERQRDHEVENQLHREQAWREDRELLGRRRERLWREDSRDRPGKLAAYQSWYREVQEIEAQLAAAEEIQSQLTPEQAVHGPLSEGTVLWHRKQRLLELRTDAPQL